MRGLLVSLIFLFCLPGCVVIQVGAKNPIPEMTTIAVAPFFNLTQEPNSVVDGRRFALAYFAELQKTPGFQVIPVGVVESTILKYRLDLHNPREALRLCELLEADAIVIGGVTDYSPYYPPRIGMQVDWYSPKEWPMADPNAESGESGGYKKFRDRCRWPSSSSPPSPPEICKKPETVRGQSPGPVLSFDLGSAQPLVRPVQQTQPPGRGAQPPQAFGPDTPYNRRPLSPDEELQRYGRKRLGDTSPVPGQGTADRSTIDVPPLGEGASPPSGYSPALPPADPTGGPTLPPPLVTPASPAPPGNFDPTQPLMSYTRIFDGADAEVVNRLRDYLELRGDCRSGGWQAYLQRSEDFIRFTCHLMIVEMLSVHGGAVKSQIVLKWRKYQ